MGYEESNEQLKQVGNLDLDLIVRVDPDTDTVTFMSMKQAMNVTARQGEHAHPLGHLVFASSLKFHASAGTTAARTVGEAGKVGAKRRLPQRRKSTPLLVRSPTHRAIDWFPSPRTRKVLGKLVADQEALVTELEQQGRTGAARWQRGITWCLLLYTGGLHLISSLASAVRGSRKAG